MKKIVLILTLCFSYVLTFAQCTPLPYQDSSFNIWPDTINNLPVVQQGVNYATTLTIKTPATLIEAANYDTAQTQVFGQYVGGWPVDSMELLSISGMPIGLTHNCLIPSCLIPGNTLTCAEISGNTNDPIGIYPIIIDIKVYTHGTITIGVPIPIDTNVVDQILGYKLVINSATGIESFHQDDFVLFQNAPNPFSDKTKFIFNSPKSSYIEFTIIDMFGREVYAKNIAANKGVNTFKFNHNLSAGIYMYSISNGTDIISKRMIATGK